MTDKQAINQSSNNQPIPATLLDGLKKIEAEGTIPLIISRQLESYLTEIGLFDASMTPIDAWEALRQFHAANPQPQNKTADEPSLQAVQVEPENTTPTQEKEQSDIPLVPKTVYKRRAKRR